MSALSSIAEQVENRNKMIAGIILYCVAPIGMSLLPLLVGAATETLNLSAKQAGWLATADYAGIATAALLVSFIIRKVSWRVLAISALVPLIIVNLYSTTVDNFPTLLIARFLAEFGTGIIFSLAIMMIGETRNPDRSYAIGIGLTIGLSTLIYIGLPGLIDTYGLAIVFLTHAALSVLILPALIWIPGGIQTAKGGVSHPLFTALFSIDVVKLLPVFMAFCLFTAAEGGVWAYLETLGNNAGLSDQTVGNILALTQLAGVGAALLVAWLSTKWGRQVPLLGGLVFFGIGALALLYSNLVGYFLGAMITQFFYIFLVPYFLLICVEADKSKQNYVLSTPFKLFGFALGPAVIAFFIEGYGYAVISYVTLAMLVFSALLILPSLKKLDLDKRDLDKLEDTV